MPQDTGDSSGSRKSSQQVVSTEGFDPGRGDATLVALEGLTRMRFGTGLLGVTIEEGEPFALLEHKRLLEIERRILAIEERLAASQPK